MQFTIAQLPIAIPHCDICGSMMVLSQRVENVTFHELQMEQRLLSEFFVNTFVRTAKEILKQAN